MQFHKFHTIENNYREAFIQAITLDPVYNEEWVVMEKAHGANLNFTTDGQEVRLGKRTSFTDGTFFNCQSVYDRYKDSILKLISLTPYKTLTVYGELIGGHYPSVKKPKNSGKCPQTEIWYCPQSEFYAFDIRADGHYLSYDECIKYFSDDIYRKNTVEKAHKRLCEKFHVNTTVNQVGQMLELVLRNKMDRK